MAGGVDTHRREEAVRTWPAPHSRGLLDRGWRQPKGGCNEGGAHVLVTVLDRYGHLRPPAEDEVTNVLDAMARAAASSAPTGEIIALRHVDGTATG